MLRGNFHFWRKLAFASIAALALCAGLAISAPTFADTIDTGTASGGSGDAAASASGDGSTSAGIDSTVDSQAGSGSNGGSAETTTDAGASARQNGDEGNTSADANTLASAGVTADGKDLTAEALAAANASGTSETNDGGLANAGSDSLAFARATNGNSPTALALAGSDTWAFAVGGKNFWATAFAGLDSIVKTKNGKRRSITIAYSRDGQYSIAIATKRRASAFASTYGDGGAFTVDDVFAAAKTAAKAFATAGKNDASAAAQASGRGVGGNSYGISAAASTSSAFATLRIVIHRSPTASSASAPMLCTVKVVDWKKWKRMSLAERKRHVLCCPSIVNVKFGQQLASNACEITASLRGSTTIRLGKNN